VSAPRELIRFLKNQVVPRGSGFRRLPWGLAAGCVMRIDFRSASTLYLGLYEIELVKHFRKLVRKGYNCFDVGGNGGYYALALAKMSGGNVVSLECDRLAAQMMRETFARNPFPIQTIEGFVAESCENDRVTLDAIATQTFVPDFIKMDIEGAEADALLGAQSILKSRKPSMIIEVHGQDVERKCLEILRSYDYAPQVQEQGHLFREMRPLSHNRWLICEGR
jgi:hypothetical protein